MHINFISILQVVIDTTGSIQNCSQYTSAPTQATCEYCHKNIPDPSVRYCEVCSHSTQRKHTTLRQSDNDTTQVGPPCSHCGNNLNVDPAAHTCPFCGTRDRQRWLEKHKAESDSSQRIRTHQPVFGPSANFNPLFHGGAPQLQYTDQVRNGATVNEPVQSVQRKRTGSDSSLEQTVKHPKVDVDSSSCMVIPKNGQKVDHSLKQTIDAPPPDLAPTKDADAHEHADCSKSTCSNRNDRAEKVTKDPWYSKSEKPEELLPPQGHKSDKGKPTKNPPKPEPRQPEMADPRYCI